MAKSKLYKNQLVQLLISLLIIILIAFISSRVFFRLDLTFDKRYSINENTKTTLSELPDIIYVKVYLDGDLPASFESLKTSVVDMLGEFRAYGGKNIQYEFINPLESENKKDRDALAKLLIDKGIQPRTIRLKDKDGYKEQYVFPGAVVTYREKEDVINFLNTKNTGRSNLELLVNSAKEHLEYNFLNTFRNITTESKKKIAFIRGHGELAKDQTMELGLAFHEMYDVFSLDIGEKIHALIDHRKLNYDAVIIAKPRDKFSEKDKYIIDQYIMHGGKVLWMVDYADISMDSLSYKSETTMLPLQRKINLSDMLFRYGVRINTGVVQDMQSAPIPINTAPKGSDPQFTPVPWVFFPVLVPKSQHLITRNIGIIKTEFINPIDTVGGDPNVKKTILLNTSKYSRVVSTPALVSLSLINEKSDPRLYPAGKQNIAVLLEGQFQSVFKNRLVKEFVNNKNIDYKSQSIDTKMIVVSDGDICKNPIIHRNNKIVPLPLGADKWFSDIFFDGNKEFLLNAVNYLTNDEELIALRGRKFKLRLLDRPKLNNEKAYWQLINIILPILIVIIGGGIFVTVRRYKYSKKN